MFKARLVQAMEGNSLTEREMEEAMEALLEEPVPPLQVAAFLAALRARGETPEEITGAVRLLLRKAHAVPSTLPLLMDNCGTGGDCTGSFNISTAAAFVAAGGGIPMAKHGNRSVSSECGSADVAEALGAPLPASPEEASRCLEETGLVLLFAPHFHPLLRNVAEVRKILGVRTLFNILGPLLNPAPLTHQVMGVFDPSLPSLIAEVLRALGRKQGMVIAGHGGFDELSLGGPNRVAFFSERGVREEFVTPEDAGLPFTEGGVSGGNAPRNASIIEEILQGKRGAHRDVVLFNAAAVFLASGQAAGWREGVAMAEESIDSGRAAGILEKLRDFARSESLVQQSA